MTQKDENIAQEEQVLDNDLSELKEEISELEEITEENENTLKSESEQINLKEYLCNLFCSNIYARMEMPVANLICDSFDERSRLRNGD